MQKERNSDIVTIIIVPLVFWAGLLAAAFAKELNLPNWLPRAVLIVYALALGLYIVGGSLSFGLRWSERLVEQHRSRLRILALLPGYVLLACVAWLIIALASRQVPDGTPVPLIALLLARVFSLEFCLALSEANESNMEGWLFTLAENR